MTLDLKRLIPVLLLALTSVDAGSQAIFRSDVSYPALAPSRMQADDSRPVFCDNSESEYFPEIIMQFGGSCAQASGIHYLFTYEMNRFLDRPAKGHPENVFSYRWTWHLLNGGQDEGSIASDGIEIVMKAGCISVKDYGNEENDYYFTWPSGYDRYYRGMPYKAKAIREIDLSTMIGINTLMDYFLDKHDGHKGGGVVSFSLTGDSNDGTAAWGYGPYNGPSSCGMNSTINMEGSGGAHAMTLVGYDLAFEKDFDGDGMISEPERGAFILVNSWGTFWQSNGKSYMPFYYFLNAGEPNGVNSWDSRAMAIDVEYKEPSLCFQVNLDYTSRNDLTFRFGVADGAQAKQPDRKGIIHYPFPAGQGGDNLMRGNYFASGKNIDMGFDVSELEPYVSTLKAPCYFLIINKSVLGKSGSGHVNQVLVHDYRSGTDIVSKSENDADAGISLGLNYIRIPTRPWFKDAKGKWYDVCRTSANPITVNDDYTAYPEYSEPMAVRTAEMDYAKMKVHFDGENRSVKLDITRYE